MISEITMPSMGADMTEGTIVKWLKNEGDKVSKGDKLAEIETDKTVVEMESYNEGILKKILVNEGTKIGVGKTIAYIGDPNDAIPDIASIYKHVRYIGVCRIHCSNGGSGGLWAYKGGGIGGGADQNMFELTPRSIHK